MPLIAPVYWYLINARIGFFLWWSLLRVKVALLWLRVEMLASLILLPGVLTSKQLRKSISTFLFDFIKQILLNFVDVCQP